jgi:hypothetical protein
MLLYRFKIDETVIANADGVSPGPYRIARLLTVSEDTGVPNYRVKDIQNSQEMALAETALRRW